MSEGGYVLFVTCLPHDMHCMQRVLATTKLSVRTSVCLPVW